MVNVTKTCNWAIPVPLPHVRQPQVFSLMLKPNVKIKLKIEIRLSRPLEDLDFNKVRFGTMALLAGRIPTIITNQGIHLYLYMSAEEKHKTRIKSSFTMKLYYSDTKTLSSD